MCFCIYRLRTSAGASLRARARPMRCIIWANGRAAASSLGITPDPTHNVGCVFILPSMATTPYRRRTVYNVGIILFSSQWSRRVCGDVLRGRSTFTVGGAARARARRPQARVASAAAPPPPAAPLAPPPPWSSPVHCTRSTLGAALLNIQRVCS
ncbi:hypothetical protein EVAR_5918_1 [Eumeta japonica]|uniref:Uncharacterized protein n=1 Tax=Eumeta variegata TaxID=151549 RepID=A0A4C1TFL5_EUMVA|nr:hypothetical protein EVAR_5918_1 [Eumeta japonica]